MTTTGTRMWWRFQAWDSWFFRESRPFGSAVGGGLVQSEFPPPARTLAGAVRRAIADHLQADLGALSGVHSPRNRDHAAAARRGEPLILARLFERMRLGGPYVLLNGERLYPMPANVLFSTDDSTATLLAPDTGTLCDLGLVCLPRPSRSIPGARTLPDAWLTADGMTRVLAGEPPRATDVVREEQIVVREYRMGIGRVRGTRLASDGRLFQTEHLRLREGVEIALTMDGVTAETVPRVGSVDLGGEGRMAHFAVSDAPHSWRECVSPPFTKEHDQFQLVFLTPTAFGGTWTDSRRFDRLQDDNGLSFWRTRLFGKKQDESTGIAVRIYCGVNYSYQYEGGWNLGDGANRVTRGLLPAGSVWYCKLERPTDYLNVLAPRMNQGQLGSERDLGRGEIILGHWN